jgi:hypothetical protein
MSFKVSKKQTIGELGKSIMDTCELVGKADVAFDGLSLKDDSTIGMEGIEEGAHLVATTKKFKTLAEEWYNIQSAKGMRPDTTEGVAHALLSKSFWEHCTYIPTELPIPQTMSFYSRFAQNLRHSHASCAALAKAGEIGCVGRMLPFQRQAMKDLEHMREEMMEYLKQDAERSGTDFEGFLVVANIFRRDFPFYSKLKADGCFPADATNMYDV